jgi:hypothetical protein
MTQNWPSNNIAVIEYQIGPTRSERRTHRELRSPTALRIQPLPAVLDPRRCASNGVGGIALGQRGQITTQFF